MNNQEIKRKLFHPATDKYNFLAQLKAESNYESFQKKIKSIRQHPFGRHALSANPLPKSISELRKNNITPHSNNIESEIAWLMFSIKENSEKVKLFIDLKTQYEQNILLNNYDKAKSILEKVESTICYSTWGSENKLILIEDNEGTEKNWLLLDEYAKSVKDQLSLFIIEQSSKKSEKKLTYSRYKQGFENIINETTGLLHEYLCFRVFHTGFIGFENFSFFINVESISSIIDRYNVLIDVLIELIPTKKNEFINTVVKELIEFFPNDKRLIQLSNIVSSDFILLKNTETINQYINQYSVGNYKYCIDEINQILLENLNIIEPYIIYVKSLIEIGEKFKRTNISNGIDKILLKLYNVYSLNKDFKSSMEDLLKISQKYFTFNFGKQLFSIVSRLGNLNDNNYLNEFYYVINSEFNNPIILNFIDTLGEEISSKIKLNFKPKTDSICYSINHLISNGDYKGIENNKHIATKRKGVYLAKAMHKANENQKLIKHLERVLDEDEISIITEKELIEILFKVYILEDEIEKALVLYTNAFFKNKNLILRLDSIKLLDILKKHETPILIIDLPIFYQLNSQDIYENFVKYDEYLDHMNAEKPTQICDNKGINKTKLIYFLREICIIEIMHHSLNFEGTDDIEKERVEILKHLLSLDSINEPDYIKEITEITQKAKIRNAIREVNKGRITINSQQLKNIEENSIKDSFIRFKELVVFSNQHGIKSIDATSKMLNEYFDSINDNSFRNKVVNINDPAFIAFKTMFIDLRDKFVLSKDYGLDGYLSTRIRHGTLLNHIRSNFEALNLISQKSDEVYIDNNYWLGKTPQGLFGKEEEIQNAIKKFSNKVDEFTEYIIKELIQVKTEKYSQKPLAFFDFTLSDSSLAYLFKETKDEIHDYTTFLNFVFDYLERVVEVSLNNIRHYFNKEINENYTSLINVFDNEIRTIIGHGSFVDLTNSIVKCQTNIQNELQSISEWFNVSNPSSESILDVETIVQTAVEITNTIYPNQKISPQLKIGTKIPFRSGTTNLIYIFRILLDNIIKHSGLQKGKRNIIIESNIENENILAIKVSNDINTKESKRITTKLDAVRNKWNDKENDFSKSNIEGGSGFEKIRRILAVDMKMNIYSFDYLLNKNNLTIIINIEIHLNRAT